MIRLIPMLLAPVLAVAAVVALPREAAAGLPGPVCRLETVVDVMARELGTQAIYGWLDSAVIEEAPTADPRVVRCGVCLMTGFYDTTLYGNRPVARCEPRVFSVEALRNGYVVRPVR
jgi:hypothetical protein